MYAVRNSLKKINLQPSFDSCCAMQRHIIVDINNSDKRNNCKLFKKQIEMQDVTNIAINQLILNILSSFLKIKCRSLRVLISAFGSKYLSAEYPSQVDINKIAHSQQYTETIYVSLSRRNHDVKIKEGSRLSFRKKIGMFENFRKTTKLNASICNPTKKLV